MCSPGRLSSPAGSPHGKAGAPRVASRESCGADSVLNAGSLSWSSDNHQWALTKSQCASPVVPIGIGGPTKRGWLPRPGAVPWRGVPCALPSRAPGSRGARRAGGLQFPECPAATGGARERPQPIRGSAGSAGQRQVEPGGWAGAGPAPRRRPGARGLGVGRGASGAGAREEPPGAGPSGAGSVAARAVPGAPAARSPGRT